MGYIEIEGHNIYWNGKHNVQTIAALRNVLQEEWNNLRQEEVRNLINSMPQRIRKLQNARGSNTHY